MLPSSNQKSFDLGKKNIKIILPPNKNPNNATKIKNNVFLLTKKLKINTHRSHFSMDNTYINYSEQLTTDKETARKKYNLLEKKQKNNYNAEENNEKISSKVLNNFKDILTQNKKKDNQTQKDYPIINYKKLSGNILYKKKKYTNSSKISESTDISFGRNSSCIMTNNLNQNNHNSIVINKTKQLNKKNINRTTIINNTKNNVFINNKKNKSKSIDFPNNTSISKVYKTIIEIRARYSRKNLPKKNQNNKLSKKFCDIIKNIFEKRYKNFILIFFDTLKKFQNLHNSKINEGEISNIKNINTSFMSMNTSISSIITNNTEKLRDKIIYNNKKRLRNQSFQKQNLTTVLNEIKHSKSDYHIIKPHRKNKKNSGNENKFKSLKKIKKKNIKNMIEKDKNTIFLKEKKNNKVNIPLLMQTYSKYRNSKFKIETKLLFIKQNTINTKDNKLTIDIKYISVKSVISKTKSDFKKYKICNKISIFYYNDKDVQLTDRNLCRPTFEDYLSVIKEESEIFNGTSGFKRSLLKNQNSNIITKVNKDIDVECSKFNKTNN